jgi:hypothetical protein
MVFYLSNMKMLTQKKTAARRFTGCRINIVKVVAELVGCENTGHAVPQNQPGDGQNARHRPEVVSYVAFNVKPFVHAFSQLLH